MFMHRNNEMHTDYIFFRLRNRNVLLIHDSL